MNIAIGITVVCSGMALLFGTIYFIFKGMESTFTSDNLDIEAQDEAEHQPPPPEDGKWKIIKPSINIK
jgi:hypothetical protein